MTKDFAYVIEVRNLKIGWVAFITQVDQISHVRQELLQLSPLKQEEASKMEQKGTSGRFPLWEGSDPPLLEEGQVLIENMRRNTENMEKQWLALGWHSAGRSPALQLKKKRILPMTRFIQEPPDESSAIQHLDFNLMKLRAEKQV